MKKITLLMAALVMTGMSFAQNAIDRYFTEYKNDPLFTKVEITGKMMELAGYIEPQNDQEKQLSEAIQKIDGISVLLREELVDGKAMYNAAIKKTGSSFEELMTVTEETTQVKLMVKENNGIITELLVFVCDKAEFCLVDIYGEIDLSTIRSITEGMQINGLVKVSEEMLEAAGSVRMYPNPVSQGQNVTLTFDAAVDGGTVITYDSNGKKVSTQKLNGTSAEINTSSMNAGVYTVVIEKGNNRVFSQALMVK